MNSPDNDIVVIVPVYNDAASLDILVRELDDTLSNCGSPITIVAVDDGSVEPVVLNTKGWNAQCIREIRCLRLRGNMGHQRAIAIGLSYVHQHIACEAVLVMDADGEDTPADAARLVERIRDLQHSSIVFAERTKRSEGLTFLLFYTLYKGLMRVLTGHSVRVGNFSIIPFTQLDRLVIRPELWTHYAATVYLVRTPRDLIPTKRGTRWAGKPTMNYIALVTHGLSAVSVFGAIVGVRMTILCIGASLISVISWLTYIGFASDEVTNESLISGTGMTFLFCSQMLIASFSFVSFIIGNSDKSNITSSRDYAIYIADTLSLYSEKD
ncbi:MAG TPA: glycosyltransferase [Nitrospirales bacterium]|nr:glycosyltransferase [Nitrospirales bacterium]